MRSDKEILDVIYKDTTNHLLQVGPEQVAIRKQDAMLELLMDIRSLLIPLSRPIMVFEDPNLKRRG